MLQDQVETTEPAEAGATASARQRGEGAPAATRGPRGELDMLSTVLPGTMQLSEHSGCHIPKRHVRAQLPDVVTGASYVLPSVYVLLCSYYSYMRHVVRFDSVFIYVKFVMSNFALEQPKSTDSHYYCTNV